MKNKITFYEKLKRELELNLQLAKVTPLMELNGFCAYMNNVNKFPELMKFKPEEMESNEIQHWFPTDPHGPQAELRIMIVTQIIKDLKNGK